MARARSLRTGQVAKLAGVHVETLRYYERRGLLEKPTRLPSGYRQYGSEAVRVIRFVKRAQELGFTLREIEELLRLRNDRSASCAQVRAAAQGKLAIIEQKIRDLQRMRQALGVLVKSCGSDGSVRRCPILEALDQRRGAW